MTQYDNHNVARGLDMSLHRSGGGIRFAPHFLGGVAAKALAELSPAELLARLTSEQKSALAAKFAEQRRAKAKADQQAALEAEARRRIAARAAAAREQAAAAKAEAARKARVAAGWKQAVSSVNGRNAPVTLPPTALDRAAASLRAQRDGISVGGR